MVDFGEIRYIQRIAVTPHNNEGTVTARDVEAALELLNRCLTEHPRGEIIAIEHTPCIMEDSHGTHYFRFVCYHVGFPRKPLWLTE